MDVYRVDVSVDGENWEPIGHNLPEEEADKLATQWMFAFAHARIVWTAYRPTTAEILERS